MLFVDGLGLGARDPSRNPLCRGGCPAIERMLAASVPLDARMGVEGLPQSATGQTALLTGVNAAVLAGRHVEGLPPPRLRERIRERTLFSELVSRGYRATFANAYYVDDVETVRAHRRQSVTTVAALAAFDAVRDASMMRRGQAVYQDLTRRVLTARGYDGPFIRPGEAAEHLMGIVREHDFTLFEYFQTDRVGHKGGERDIARVLGELDEFLSALGGFPKEECGLLLLTSDHGNIEDLSVRTHTLNPVPLFAEGCGAEVLRQEVRRIEDFAGALLSLYPPRARRAS